MDAFKTTLRALTLLAFCISHSAYGAAAAPQKEAEAKATWIDSSHGFVANRADALVGWVDSFFGRIRSDQEAAQSFLRLQFQNEWDEEDGNDTKIRLRGKVELPQINKRLGLIFSDESGDSVTVSDDFNRQLANESTKTDIALQYTKLDDDRSRLDFKLGLPSFKLKLAARYRYLHPITTKLFGRFTEEVSFRDGKGFTADTRFDLDYVLNENRLLRWGNRAKYGQETAGVQWSSSIELNQRIDDKQAVSFFSSVSGVTRADYSEDCQLYPSRCLMRERSPWLTDAYGVGMLYRRNFFRRWLFAEVEPAVLWRRRAQFDSNRESVFVLTARLEVLLHRQSEVPAQPRKQDQNQDQIQDQQQDQNQDQNQG